MRKSIASTRRPLFLILAITITVMYAMWTVVTFYYDNRELRKFARDRTHQQLINTYQTSYILIEDNQLNELGDRLREAKNADEIFAYELRKNNETVFGIDRNGIIPELGEMPAGRPVYGDRYSRVRLELNGFELILVVRPAVDDQLRAQLIKNLPLLFRDFAITMLLTAWIATYFLSDLTRAITLMSKGNRKQAKQVGGRALSDEGEMLLRGLSAMDQSLDQLESQNLQLRNQVLPALRSELSSGKKPPYEFDCTLVRVDVNNFSYIFNHYPVEEFMGVINGFFETVTHIVSRYGGYVYEFVGDEVIFYFKDAEQTSSAQTTLAALRDICAAAEKLDREIKPIKGYDFRVKCSAAHGKLRFGPQVSGYSLAGTILIDTVRILSLINERERNVILYDEFVAMGARPIVKSEPYSQVILKGSSHAQQIYSYVSHEDFAEVLGNFDETHAEVLNLYRGDAHLLQLFKKMGSDEISRASFLSMTRKLRNFTIHQSSREIAEGYHALVSQLVKKHDAFQSIDKRALEDLYFKLSTILTIGRHVLDKTHFESTLKGLFTECLKIKDRRVISNSLDAFSHFDAVTEDALLVDLMKHKDNRVAANAVIREGIRGLSKAVVKYTTKMLRSKDPLFKSSALYVIGELAAHHKAENPVYFETHVAFGRLISEIEPLIGHANEMVRRQALIAARKTRDEKLKKSIHNYYQGLVDAARKLEIEQLYLHPNGDAARTPRESRAA